MIFNYTRVNTPWRCSFDISWLTCCHFERRVALVKILAFHFDASLKYFFLLCRKMLYLFEIQLKVSDPIRPGVGWGLITLLVLGQMPPSLANFPKI